MTLYLNTPNKRGWGVVYIRLRVGQYLLRMSTTIKVHRDFWNVAEGCVIVSSNADKVTTALHSIAENNLKRIREVVNDYFFAYLCSNAVSVNDTEMIADIKNNLSQFIATNVMTKRKTNEKSLTLQLKEVVEEMPNLKTRHTISGIVNNFKTFLEIKGIKDVIVSLNMDTLRCYREYLVNECTTRGKRIGGARGADCLNTIFFLSGKLERKHGYDFKLDESKIEPIRDVRSNEDKRRNGIALTAEEIEKVECLQVSDTLVSAKDMFLLQCYCGFRYEDMPNLLNSKNVKEIDGVLYSIFSSDKEHIISHTPLNAPNLYPQALAIFKKYVDKCPFVGDSGQSTYNKAITKIARLAKLGRIMTKSETEGEKKIQFEIPICEELSSHDLRHTFITNVQRYKGLTPDIVSHISAHSDTRMIESVYTNFESIDKVNAINAALNKQSQPTTTTSDNMPNFGIKGVYEAREVLDFMGIAYDNTMSFEELISRIEQYQSILNRKFGIPYTDLKKIFNLSGLSLEERIDTLKYVLNKWLRKKNNTES